MLLTGSNKLQNTTHKVVIPFYLYAAFSFLAATLLLLFSTNAFSQHHFHPHTMAITHTMALGWGTMIILGASHQLVPVLIEGKLYSTRLAWISFFTAATGIPLLVYSFFTFQMGMIAQAGAILINLSVISFLVNIAMSIAATKKENVHAIFIFTATLWLLTTTIVGLLLVFNFSMEVLPGDSLQYLSLHAHFGIIGWFLLLVLGVGSRLIPMFLISKYSNPKLLWIIYGLINSGLAAFLFGFISEINVLQVTVPVISIGISLVLFSYYCFSAFRQRIRKNVDGQMKLSLASVALMILPLILMLLISAWIVSAREEKSVVLAYGFTIFFGWITAIILGMTFKTLPFIVWNKVYHKRAGKGKSPNPKDLFSNRVFTVMSLMYIAGFAGFLSGLLTQNMFIVQLATLFLLASALLYNWNVIKMVLHKPESI